MFVPGCGTEYRHVVVLAQIGVDEGRVGLQRVHVVEHRRERLVVDLDEIDCLAGDLGVSAATAATASP